MKRFLAVAVTALAGLSIFAAGSSGLPVAEGFPDWTGLDEKNHFPLPTGTKSAYRSLEPCDLRQKAVVVVEFDLDKAVEQFEKIPNFSNAFPVPTMPEGCVEGFKMTRNVQVIFINRSADRKGAKLLAKIKAATVTDPFLIGTPNIYHDVTFAGAPDTTGKRPYAYVLGPDGKTPLWEGSLEGLASLTAIKEAVSKASNGMSEWMDFYGFSTPSETYPSLKATIAAGKPLKGEIAKIAKDVKSADESVRVAAQKLLDGLNQTRSDLVYQVRIEAHAAPHLAIYHAWYVQRYWPEEKKRLEKIVKPIRSNKLLAQLGDVTIKIDPWLATEFDPKPAQAKKVAADVAKMRKKIAPIKEQSQDIRAQNVALIVDTKLEDLESAMKARAEVKK